MSATRAGRTFAAAIVMVALAVASGCSSSTSSSSPTTTVPSKATPEAKRRAAVDVAQVRRRDLPPGHGVPEASATVTAASETAVDRGLDPGYVEAEYLLEGAASTYSGPPTGPVVEAERGVRYATRVLVRYPRKQKDFSGRVVLEPFNTSGGADADVVWSSVAPLLQEQGDAWVGVTERTSAVEKLKEADAQRYADVVVPSNDVAWDIMRQLGAVLKAGGSESPLQGLRVKHLYLSGYSQSALDVATFAMAFSDRTGTATGAPVYDGYFPAAHSGTVTPIRSGTGALPKFVNVAIAPVGDPLIDLETQSDVEGFKIALGGPNDYTSPGVATVRRSDSDEPGDLFRLYEIAGAPHAGKIPSCDGDGSSFPTQYFLDAALSHLFRWAEEGVAPPKAQRITLSTDDVVSVSQADEAGNAVGGVRSPFVDVPLSHYEVHSTPGPICKLSSRETPLAPAVLRDRYGSADKYVSSFATSLDRSIRAGFLRRQDRAAILTEAKDKARVAFATS